MRSPNFGSIKIIFSCSAGFSTYIFFHVPATLLVDYRIRSLRIALVLKCSVV